MIRLAVRAPAGSAEPVLAALLDIAPEGLEQVDGPGWVEYAVYGEAGALPLEPGDATLPARGWRCAPTRWPTTGPSAGAPSTGPPSSAAGCGCARPGSSAGPERWTS